MAKKFLVPIDMCNLEIQNFVAHNLAAAPTGSDGKIYFNTVDSKLYYYNGTSWIALTEGAIYSGTSPINVNGTTISISAATTSAAGSMSSSDKTKLNGIATGAEVNQNAFSNVKVGSTTVAADSKTDTLELVAGSNVTLTPDATNDKVTIAATDTTYSAGTEALLTTGTDTANRVWQPKILHDYIASVVGGVDAMRFKGTVDSNSDLPTTGVKVGDTYMVNTAGIYAGQTCEVGDLIIATATTPTWTVAQTNIDGAITSLTGTSPISVTGSGSSRTVSITAASTSAAGSMSSSDKTKLNGIATGAQVNVLEGVQIAGTDLAISNKKVNVPKANNTTWGAVKVTRGLTEGTNTQYASITRAGSGNSDQYITFPVVNGEYQVDSSVLPNSGVTAGTYKAGDEGKDGVYIPSITVDAAGRITSASEIGSLIPTVNRSGVSSAAHGCLVTQKQWRYVVQGPNAAGQFTLRAGQTSAEFSVYVQTPPGFFNNFVVILGVNAIDSDGNQVIVDWNVDSPLGTQGTSNYITLSVSIASAYDKNIYILPIMNCTVGTSM